MTDSMRVAKELAKIVKAHDTLTDLGVVRSQKLLADFGEWFGCRLLRLDRCQNRAQKGWDIGTPARRIQVKTHAKAQSNRGHRTTLSKDELEFDELLILVLTSRYKMQDMYLIPREEVERLAPFRNGKRIIKWAHVRQFAIREVPSDLAPLLVSSVEELAV